jgi:hypothetical protein
MDLRKILRPPLPSWKGTADSIRNMGDPIQSKELPHTLGLIVGQMAMGTPGGRFIKRSYNWNEEDKIEQAFLKGIAVGFPKSKAAKRAGIHRTTLFRWLERKPEFVRNFARA